MENPTSIRNIIFDLGGVLLNINPLLSLAALEQLSGINRDPLLNKLVASRIFQKIDTGILSPEKFRKEMGRILGVKLSDEKIDFAWNALLLDFPARRIEMLEKLKQNYRIFLLSNTNYIHYQHYTKIFELEFGYPFPDLFEKLYLSFELGMHKPDQPVYEHVLRTSELKAEQTLFIDDSLANIEAAMFLNIRCIHIQNGTDVTSCFKDGYLSSDFR